MLPSLSYRGGHISSAGGSASSSWVAHPPGGRWCLASNWDGSVVPFTSQGSPSHQAETRFLRTTSPRCAAVPLPSLSSLLPAGFPPNRLRKHLRVVATSRDSGLRQKNNSNDDSIAPDNSIPGVSQVLIYLILIKPCGLLSPLCR